MSLPARRQGPVCRTDCAYLSSTDCSTMPLCRVPPLATGLTCVRRCYYAYTDAGNYRARLFDFDTAVQDAEGYSPTNERYLIRSGGLETLVLIKGVDGAWKIAHYNLTIPIPNDLANAVVEMIRKQAKTAAAPRPKCRRAVAFWNK